MVWIHGGDLSSGTSSAFDGASIAANQDVVVVTLNYRVNGILHLIFHLLFSLSLVFFFLPTRVRLLS